MNSEKGKRARPDIFEQKYHQANFDCVSYLIHGAFNSIDCRNTFILAGTSITPIAIGGSPI
jgi:hypothetical protein